MWVTPFSDRLAHLAHVPEVLPRQGLRDAAPLLERLPRHDGATLHVVHHQQHLVAAGVIHHFLQQLHAGQVSIRLQTVALCAPCTTSRICLQQAANTTSQGARGKRASGKLML